LQQHLYISGSIPAPDADVIIFPRPESVAVQGQARAVAGLQPPALQFPTGNTNVRLVSTVERERRGKERTPANRRIDQTETVAKSVELLTPSQVCEMLKLSESTFFRLVRRMAFPVVRLGKSLRVRRTALDTYLSKMET
jgi:excisionase family DNA binding protein